MKNFAIENGVTMLKAIANAKRLEILFLLKNNEFNVSEIESKIMLSQSALSQHLAVLRKAGVVKTKRQSQIIFYSIKNDKVNKILEFLDKLYNNPYRSMV